MAAVRAIASLAREEPSDVAAKAYSEETPTFGPDFLIPSPFDPRLILRIAPGAFAVIFVICLSSFAVALTLGGGPRATTVELAIYQAVRFDFDLGRAALLSVIQLGLAVIAGLVGGGGLGVFVFQGISQNAGDLVLLGALPTVALATGAAVLLDAVIDLSRGRAAERTP